MSLEFGFTPSLVCQKEERKFFENISESDPVVSNHSRTVHTANKLHLVCQLSVPLSLSLLSLHWKDLRAMDELLMKELWLQLVMSAPGADMGFVDAHCMFSSYILSSRLT